MDVFLNEGTLDDNLDSSNKENVDQNDLPLDLTMIFSEEVIGTSTALSTLDPNPDLDADLDSNPDSSPDSDYVPIPSEGEEEGSGSPIITRPSRPSKGRKRLVPSQTVAGSKKLRASNEKYFTYKKAPVEPKVFKDYNCKRQYLKVKPPVEGEILDLSKSKTSDQPEKPQNPYCRLVCPLNLSSAAKEKFFNEYWALGDYNSQSMFIAANVTERVKERMYNKRSCASTKTRKRAINKEFSRVYHLNSVPVCRETFINTLQISSKRVDTALKKVRCLSLQDQRGRPQGGSNALTPLQLEQVKSHIEKFPRYKSHYRRSESESEFLAADMNLVKMFDLYVEDMIGESESEKIEVYRSGDSSVKKNIIKEVKAVSLSSYKRIFYQHFNLKFKSLKKDTCQVCDSLAAQLASATGEARKTLEERQKDHFEQWQFARAEMQRDKVAAQKDQSLECLTFDLEKTLPLPRIPTNIVFYKRQLWLYNAGVHCLRNGQGYFYPWTENQAGRGAQEIGSVLLKHIKGNVSDGVKHLILYSDSCGGQNRNIKIVLLMKACLEQHQSLLSITFKFLVPGHTYLPNDTDFSDVECALKYSQRLYLPEDYLNVMRRARRKKPFIVTRMQATDFFSSENLEKLIVNRKKIEKKDEAAEEGLDKINWLHIREIKLFKAEPCKLHCRTDFVSEYKVVDIERKPSKKSKEPKKVVSFTNALKLMRPNGKSIAAPKLADLKDLMHLIPEDAKAFYQNLTGDNDIVDDIDGFCSPLDFEEEETEQV